MESPMLTRIKSKKQEEPSTARILGEMFLLGTAGLAAIVIIFAIIAKFG